MKRLVVLLLMAAVTVARADDSKISPELRNLASNQQAQVIVQYAPSTQLNCSGLFGLIGCAVKILSRLFFFAPLLVLGGAHYLSVFSAEQLHALALLSLRVDYNAEAIAMVFFGFSALLKGYLVSRSTFLPRILGVL